MESPGLPTAAVNSQVASELKSLESDGVKVLKSGQNAVVTKSYAILEWWRRPCSPEQGSLPRWREFPAWGALLRRVALVPPTSAAAERVFSLLKIALGKQSQCQLADRVEASLLLRHNDRDV